MNFADADEDVETKGNYDDKDENTKEDFELSTL